MKQRLTTVSRLTIWLLAFFLAIASTHAQPRKILFQGFWWDYKNNNYIDGWSNYLTELSPRLRSMGIDAVWIPPTVKNQAFGEKGVGYAPFDNYDLGDKYQKGDVKTRLGDKDELLRLIAVMHANGLDVIQDVVPNHLIGAGSDTGAGGEDPAAATFNSSNDPWKNFRYTSYATPATDQSATDYLSRRGRFPKNWQNFHANPGFNCLSGDWCSPMFGPDIAYCGSSHGQSSNAIWNPVQTGGNNDGNAGTCEEDGNGYMRRGYREWLIWYKKQTGFDGVRWDAVKHFPSSANEDWLWNLQNGAGWANGTNDMFSVGEWVGDAGALNNWCAAVSNRSGTFDFSLRGFGAGGAIKGLVSNNLSGSFTLSSIPGSQQTNRLRTVPFVNNHDTFRPILDPATGNYSKPLGDATGWNLGSQLDTHIDPREPRLALGYAIIAAVDGSPQIFFEDLFDVGTTSKRFTHRPTSTVDLPTRAEIENIILCRQALNFAAGNYAVPYQDPDLLVLERTGRALVCVYDQWNPPAGAGQPWRKQWIDTQFAPGTRLIDYGGSHGTQVLTVAGDRRVEISVPPLNEAGLRRGYAIWAPEGVNLNTAYNPAQRSTTQEWEMADDLGDSHPLSLGQGGALPANSTDWRLVGKIYAEAGKNISFILTPDDATRNITIEFSNPCGEVVATFNGAGTLTNNFTPNATSWYIVRVRNTVNTNPSQRVLVRLTYTAPREVNTELAPSNYLPALPVVSQQPLNENVCAGGNARFSVAATTSVAVGLTYFWQVSTDNGSTWAAVSNGGVYSNATTANLTITGATAGMNNYRYRCGVTGAFGCPRFSNAATLSIGGSFALNSFSPSANGPGTLVVLSGSGFTGATAVEFNGVNATSFTVNSDTQITATVPVGATTGAIRVIKSGSAARSCTNFTVSSVVVWNGSAWSPGTPTSSDNVLIGSGTPNQPPSFTANNLTVNSGVSTLINSGVSITVNGVLSYTGNITVQSGGSLVQTEGSTLGSTTGTFKAQRNVSNPTLTGSTAFAYNHWGSPVQGQAANILNASSFRRRYTYHEPSAQWRNSDNGITANVSQTANPNFYLNPGNTLIPGVGYTSASNQTSFTREFTGVPNNGTITVNTSRLNVGSFAGYNFVGNPYASAILIADNNAGTTGLLEDAANSDFEASAYVFVDSENGTGTGSYRVVNAAGAQGNHVAAAQGFFVIRKGTPTAASGNITFRNAHRVGTNNADANFLRGEATGTEHLSLIVRRADRVSDNVALALADNFADEYENGRDARKIDANAELNLAARWNGERLAQLAIGKKTSLEIPLALNTTRTGEHVFAAENLPTATTLPLFLEDRATGEFYYLQAGREHKVSIAAGRYENRFFIRTIDEAAKGAQAVGTQVFSHGRELFVRANGTGTLRIFNLVGTELWKVENVQASGLARFTVPVQLSGIYVVKYTDAQGSTEAKIWLEK